MKFERGERVLHMKLGVAVIAEELEASTYMVAYDQDGRIRHALTTVESLRPVNLSPALQAYSDLVFA